MSAVGFRCFKDALAFVVLDGDAAAPKLRNRGRVQMPLAARSEQLVWVRKEVQEIVRGSTPTKVAFRAAEPIARTKDLGRAEVEGVLQEAVRSLGHEPHRRILKQMKADLGFEGAAKYLPSVLVGPLDGLPANQREAALVALAALSIA